MGINSFHSTIRLRDDRLYKVIYQHQNECRLGCIDVFCRRVDDGHIIRILGFNPLNRNYDSIKNYGKLKSSELTVLKKEFFYKQYCY